MGTIKMIQQTAAGFKIMQEISNISLMDLNNLLIEYPYFLGLEMNNNKVYGIVSEIGIKENGGLV